MNTTAITAAIVNTSGFAVCQNSWAAFISVGSALIISEVLPFIPSKYFAPNGILQLIALGVQKAAGVIAANPTVAAPKV